MVHWLGSSDGQCMLKTQILNLCPLQFWFSRSGALDFPLAPALSLIQSINFLNSFPQLLWEHTLLLFHSPPHQVPFFFLYSFLKTLGIPLGSSLTLTGKLLGTWLCNSQDPFLSPMLWSWCLLSLRLPLGLSFWISG